MRHGRPGGGYSASLSCGRLDWPSIQFYNVTDGKFFLHHPFLADVASNSGDANSFAEIYWEDKFDLFIEGKESDAALSKQGKIVGTEVIYRCPSDLSRQQPFVQNGQVDGVENRTSYLMNSLSKPQDPSLRVVDTWTDSAARLAPHISSPSLNAMQARSRWKMAATHGRTTMIFGWVRTSSSHGSLLVGTKAWQTTSISTTMFRQCLGTMPYRICIPTRSC